MDAGDYKEALHVWEEVRRLGLERPAEFDEMGPFAFAAIYNGYGPDDWPEELRAMITEFYEHWEELAGVHDVDFHLSDGSVAGWRAATERWRVNGAIMLEARYPLTRPGTWWKRIGAWLKIRAAWRLLQQWSWGAWVKAAEKRGRGTEERGGGSGD